MIKQTVPDGWIRAEARFVDLEHTTIPHKQIITDWVWRNRHADPIKTTIIPNQPDLIYRDKCIAAYEKRKKIS